jgi:hypothetical protein
MSDYYYDDPVEEPAVKRKRPTAIFGSALLLFAGGLFFNTTLAANINLNTGGEVEFGQGMSLTATCAGSTVLTATPSSSFVNSSGSGAHKFTTITISNIPASCATKQFSISAYQADGTPVALFNGSTSLVVASDANTINTKWDVTGVTVKGSFNAQGIGSFTATFTSSPASADLVNTITLQSSEADFKPRYSLGDTGPGGGTVYYVNYSGFTAPGAPCGTSCKYLEYAPKTWSGSPTDPGYQWSSNSSTFAVNIRNTNLEIYQSGQWINNAAIGAGFMNTQNMLTTNATTGYTADTSGAAYRVSQYAGPTCGTVGQWHLPSYAELQLIQSYTINTSGNPAGLLGWPNIGGSNRYWSSSELSTTEAASLRVDNYLQGYRAKNEQLWVRPVRVF